MDEFKRLILTGCVSAALGCAAAGWSVFPQVSSMSAAIARIELRLDNLTAARVASK